MLRNHNAQGRWFVHDAAAAVVRFAFPKHLKGRATLSEDTLKKARADGGALTTVGRMVLATYTREEAEAIREFVGDMVEVAHPVFDKDVIEYTRMENDAEAKENLATFEYHADESNDNAARLYAASVAESVIERGRRAAILRKHTTPEKKIRKTA